MPGTWEEEQGTSAGGVIEKDRDEATEIICLGVCRCVLVILRSLAFS